MKQITTLLLATSLTAVPAIAQDDNNDISEGMSMLQQGTRLLLEGLMKEIGPALSKLEDKIVDLNMYHAPEVLPNGDIIIRRKSPAEIDPPEEGEIDL
jgi:hypothetical protein